MLACAPELGCVHSGGVPAARRHPNCAARIDGRPGRRVGVPHRCGHRTDPHRPTYKRCSTGTRPVEPTQPSTPFSLRHRAARTTPPATACQAGDGANWRAIAAASRRPRFPVAATENPLSSSTRRGTTGKPKGSSANNGGHAVGAAVDIACTSIHDPERKCIWAVLDVGWPWLAISYMSTGRFLLGATTVLYEGKPVGHHRRQGDRSGGRGRPSTGRLKALFTAPTAMPRNQEGRPRRHAPRPLRPVAACATCSSRRATRSPAALPTGAQRLGIPVIDQLVADRERDGHRAARWHRGLPVKPALRRCPCRGYGQSASFGAPTAPSATQARRVRSA